MQLSRTQGCIASLEQACWVHYSLLCWIARDYLHPIGRTREMMTEILVTLVKCNTNMRAFLSLEVLVCGVLYGTLASSKTTKVCTQIASPPSRRRPPAARPRDESASSRDMTVEEKNP